MKAIFLWDDGQEIKVGGDSILLGPASVAHVAVPGAQGTNPWARITLENRRYFLTDVGSPVPLTLNGSVLKEKSQVLGGDRVRIGEAGFKFGFEIEPTDLFAGEGGPHVSPESAIRRMRHGLGETGVRKAEVRAVERTLHTESRRATTLILLLGVLMGLSTAGLVYAGLKLLRKSEERSKEREVQLERKMMSKIESASTALGAMQTRHEESLLAFKNYQQEAREEIASLEARSRELLLEDRVKNAKEVAEIQKRLEGLKVDVGENAPVERIFRDLHRTVEPGILLIASVTIYRTKAGDEEGDLRFGTGFLIDVQGTVATCKHVVQPWKYRELAEIIARAEGRYLRSIHYAWKAGEDFLDERRKIREETAFSTENDKLRVFKTTADKLVDVLVPQDTGAILLVRMETDLENDVALLRVRPYGATPLTLAHESELRSLTKLDPVMVSGFPLGNQLFEGRKVETSPSIGTMRKFETTIQITAPVSPGNSGGPVFSLDGHVIGIASYKVGAAEAIAGCVPATRVRKLLE